ncbi:unnamed protein product [Lymnaea stagnalis]|uniref:Uncharacterized protein n=1 Tax=Lymnaea stagnalis TaxID=6523 RepID=A0AAV2HJU3_LYMST
MDNKTYLQVPGMDNTSSEDRLGCGSYSHWRQDDNSNDKYTAAIELSNKCREFYKSRLEAANFMKSKWRDGASQYGGCSDGESTPSSSSSASSSPNSSSSSIASSHGNDNSRIVSSRRQRNGVDVAMERLRSEMVSLMDQDLSLMKQLLTLNETIEELKWQRQYYSCSTSCASLSASKNLDSNWSVSDTEMYDSEDDLRAATQVSGGSTQTGHVTGPTWHSTRKARKASKDFDTISLDSLTVRVDTADKTASSSDPNQNERVAIFPEDDSVCSETLDSVGNLKYGKLGSRLAGRHHVNSSSGPIVVHHEREQNSFDSGIHEASTCDDLIWNV